MDEKELRKAVDKVLRERERQRPRRCVRPWTKAQSTVGSPSGRGRGR